MNDEGPAKAPRKRSSADEDTTSGGSQPPNVAIVIEIEASPRLVVDAASEADLIALRTWLLECRPDLDRMLRTIAGELRDRKQAA